jgi:apolipoprotein N-acyltransferase
MSEKRPAVLLFFFALLSGSMLWLAWPERGFSPFIFIAFIPLLWIEEQLLARDIRRVYLRIFLYYYLTFLSWNVLTTYWIWHSSNAGSIVAIAANSLLMAIIWIIYFSTRKRYGTLVGYFSLICYWVAFEFLHLNWELSWPWLTLGNAFAHNPKWIQWYEYTGALGGSIWILIVNMVFYLLIKNLFKKNTMPKIRRINTVILSTASFVLIVFPLLISFYLYGKRPDKGSPFRVTVVQPNIDPYNEKFNGPASDQLAKLLRLSSTMIDSTTDLLLGPETALAEGIWEEEIFTDRNINTILMFNDAFPRLQILMGLSSFHAYGKDEKPSLTARKFRDADAFYDAYNTAMLVNSGDSIQLYHKSKLVPGVEKMPYPSVFGFLEDYAIQLGGTSGSLGVQKERTNFILSDGTRIAPAICYESVYGGFMSNYIRAGAELITIITNDGWWKDTPGYRQHKDYARLRAVEFRKSIARSANTGISCFINQRGDIIKETGWWEEDVISETLYKNSTITFYARYGDYLGFIAAFLSVCILLFMGVKRIVGW